MAVKIERGGWVLIFLIGAGAGRLQPESIRNRRFQQVDGRREKTASGTGETVDATKPLLLPASSTGGDAEVRVRVNVWVGCVGGLVANGGLDTQPDSIYGKKGLKVSFKIIDDWTEGSAALATDNVDVMLTTADVYAKDYAQFKEKGFGVACLPDGGLVARRRWRDRQAGNQQHRRPGRQDRGVRPVHAVALPAVERTQDLRAQH